MVAQTEVIISVVVEEGEGEGEGEEREELPWKGGEVRGGFGEEETGMETLKHKQF
jgi:hypothetical protein